MALSSSGLTDHVRGGGRYKIQAVSFLLGLTASVLSIGVQAERTVASTYEARSAFHSFWGGHRVRLTIVEAGAPTVTSRAVIELRDRANRVVARREAELTPSSPVQLDLKLSQNAGLIQLFAFIRLTTDSFELSAPLVTFEDIHPDLELTMKIDPPCGPGPGHVDPQALCPGWLEKTSPE